MIYADGHFGGLIIPSLHHKLMEEAPQVDTGHWQSLKDVPHTATRELHQVVMETPIPPTAEDAALEVGPNLPWAEDHFQERVAGNPTNPGDQYMNWPWYDPSWKAQSGVQDSRGQEVGQFSHTYQERFWPRHANDPDDPKKGGTGGVVGYWQNNGIRYRLGDLNDVLALLAREPTTRQAYLPIWFPEDTGAHHKERVPCTLGYHFILRGGLLHVTYFIRSCDFLRYFRDDVYMAMRLGHHVLRKLRSRESQNTQYVQGEAEDMFWPTVEMGLLTMHIVSLHIFEGDMGKMRREAPPTP